MKKPARGINVKVVRLAHAAGLALPAYQSEHAAGLDLLAAVGPEDSVTIAPGAYAFVPTGLTLELPPGTEAQVRPRSGLAAKFGVTVLNSPGTIDADYRGEVQVLLINHGSQPFVIRRGERIAQMVIASVVQAKLVEAKALSPTRRGAGGFGSTGVAGPREKKPIAPQLKPLKPEARRSRPAKKSRT
jgi:dUTP pyrophosphatase